MKKFLVNLIGIFFFLTGGLYAQSHMHFDVTQINAGFGISNLGIPVYAGVDYGFSDNVSLGGEVLYTSFREDFLDSYWKNTEVNVAITGNYHFNELLKLPQAYNIYAGLSAGFTMFNSTFKGSGNPDYDGKYKSGLYLTGQVGGRYYFSDKLAANMQCYIGHLLGARFGISWIL